MAETSYYPAISNLFNAVGKSLKPKVRCLMTIKNLGAGLPDGGLFTADQFQRQADGEPKAGQLPARGAIEAKGTKPHVRRLPQPAGQGLPENLRHRAGDQPARVPDCPGGPTGEPVEREAFALADDEQDFWQRKATHPRARPE